MGHYLATLVWSRTWRGGHSNAHLCWNNWLGSAILKKGGAWPPVKSISSYSTDNSRLICPLVKCLGGGKAPPRGTQLLSQSLGRLKRWGWPKGGVAVYFQLFVVSFWVCRPFTYDFCRSGYQQSVNYATCQAGRSSHGVTLSMASYSQTPHQSTISSMLWWSHSSVS